MARVGEEAATVGQHPDEAAQQPELRQLGHLPLHTVFLIVEPPAGAELHLAWHAFTLEVTDHGAQHFVITRVQAVENRFRQQVFFVLLAQQLRQLFRHRTIIDRVEADVWP